SLALHSPPPPPPPHASPTRRSSDPRDPSGRACPSDRLRPQTRPYYKVTPEYCFRLHDLQFLSVLPGGQRGLRRQEGALQRRCSRPEGHTSEPRSHDHPVCCLLL